MKAIITLLLILMETSLHAQAPKKTTYEDAYSVYITKNLHASRDFYKAWLDFDVVFEASWFVYMQSKGEKKITFALIDENHPSTPPAYGSFNGRGSFFTLQVSDVTALYTELKAKGAPITYHLKREDWGQLRFGLTDPNGLYIDIVQQIDPTEGYWEKYPPKN